MSKWLKGKEDLFQKFTEKKKQEQERTPVGIRRKDIVWPTPEKGTQEKPRIYQGRLLIDPDDNFYMSYFYHMYKDSSGAWQFVFCPKTWGMEHFCPFCSAVAKLYKGNKDDRKLASEYRRKSKHAVNFFIIKDPRDNDAQSEEEKYQGKVLVYEFPDKVEIKIKKEMADKEFGAGMFMFDPGPEGRDFLINVGATKPIQEEGPNKGKVFPDYSDSKFVATKKSLGTDEQIENIMEKRHNLTNYFKSMERSPETLIELVKAEMLHDLIENEESPKTKTTKNHAVEEMDELPWDNKEQEQVETSPEPEKQEPEMSDEELLKALENM